MAALKVSDIYSPPRGTATARLRLDLNITGVRAFDLNTPNPNGGQWDYCKSEHRKRARLICEDDPDWVIGCLHARISACWADGTTAA